MKETLVGYHGTTKINCDIIMKQKKFKPSVNKETLSKSLESHKSTYQWLGEGVYFWHNNHKRAQHWAKHNQININGQIGVLKVPITYEECRCFDLCKKEHYNVIKGFIEKLYTQNSKVVNLVSMPSDDRNKLVGAACDFFFTKKQMAQKFDLVYAVFKRKGDKLGILDESTRQICVKNDVVIEYSRMEIV